MKVPKIEAIARIISSMIVSLTELKNLQTGFDFSVDGELLDNL